MGAVSAVNSYTEFQVKVLEPVASWITAIEINCPVAPFVGADIVLFPPKVNLATGEEPTSQVTVAPSVSVPSAL